MNQAGRSQIGRSGLQGSCSQDNAVWIGDRNSNIEIFLAYFGGAFSVNVSSSLGRRLNLRLSSLESKLSGIRIVLQIRRNSGSEVNFGKYRDSSFEE